MPIALAGEFVLFLFIFIFCSKQRNGLRNFGRGSTKEHVCVIISKFHPLVQEKKLFTVFFYFSSGGHLVKRSKTV